MHFNLPARMGNQDVQLRLVRDYAALPDLIDPVFDQPAPVFEDRYEAPITLRGQVRYHRLKDEEMAISGDRQYVSGWITFRVQHLENRGIDDAERLRKARITGMRRKHQQAFSETDFRVTEVRFRGHLEGGPIIVKAFFNSEYDKFDGPG